MSVDLLYGELATAQSTWNELSDLLVQGKYDFDRKRPALDQQSLSTFRRRVELVIEILLSVHPTTAETVEYTVVGARTSELRNTLQSFQSHASSVLTQLRGNWREATEVKDTNDNFSWQLFDGTTNYANLDVTGNFQQMHPALNAIVGILGAVFPLCKARAVGDLSERVLALSNAAREASAALKQAQTHANAASGSATRAIDREKVVEETVTQAETLLTKIRELQNQATADASSVTTLTEQIKTIGANAEKLETLVTGYQSKFEAFQQQLDLRNEQFAKFESDTENAKEENAGRAAEIDRLTKQSDVMISGATTAGLAKSLEDTRRRYANRMFWARIGFFVSVSALVISALPLAAHLLPGLFGEWFPKVDAAVHTNWYGVLGKVLLLVPATWLTAFFTKSYADFFHLEREYAHKAALAMSVDGFKRQAPKYEEEITAEVFQEIRTNPAKDHPAEPAAHPFYDVLKGAVKRGRESKSDASGS